jgi:hypothetical protein
MKKTKKKWRSDSHHDGSSYKPKISRERLTPKEKEFLSSNVAVD